MIRLYFLLVVVILTACKSSKEVVYTAPYEEEFLDTLTVSAPVYDELEKEMYVLPTYNAAADQKVDILHTKLDLKFDWENEYVLGVADIDLKPYFYKTDVVELDAKNFDIDYVRQNGKEVSFTNDGQKIRITLAKVFTKEEKIKLQIKYKAKPSEGLQGGSKAITSDKGLFFINARNEDPNKPRQIWTQGETEHNSNWFPTVDKPNERMTQEILLTVDDNQKTLSNGLLVSSKNNNDGTRTDHWKQSMPHPPYLAMVAVGDFARVKDTWNGVPLEYMVDPPYEDHAKAIFNHTPEMLTFFSDLLQYPYPWEKYSQIVVEDFVSGAMENTTASVFGDFVQKTSRELIDNGNDKIVAHEMFHHWFGDLVTCESWANLTLNEGFANYSEYLWLEHKYGKDQADAHRDEEMRTYLYMVDQAGTHPLIHYAYEDKEDMFDVHSYNKGGLVLHMLRHYIGDEAFFQSLHTYLHDNKYTAVEVDELRLAFEDVTGLDLNWFFDQWYLDEGHPILKVEDSYDTEAESVKINIEQTQEVYNHRPIFILPVDVAIIHQDGAVTYHKQTIDERSDSLVITNIEAEPLAVILDGKGITLAEIIHERDPSENIAIVKHAEAWEHKIKSVQLLSPDMDLTGLPEKLMQENHQSLRRIGLEMAQAPEELAMVRDLVISDPHSYVRADGLAKYASVEKVASTDLASKILDNDKEAYPVLMTALNVLYEYDKPKAVKYAESLVSEDSPALLTVLAELLAETKEGKYLTYFEKHMEQVDIYQVFNVYGAYGDLLLAQSPELMYNSAMKLIDQAKNSDAVYRRYMATNTIYRVKQKFLEIKDQDPTEDNISRLATLKETIEDIKQTEKDSDLKSRYSEY